MRVSYVLLRSVSRNVASIFAVMEQNNVTHGAPAFVRRRRFCGCISRSLLRFSGCCCVFWCVACSAVRVLSRLAFFTAYSRCCWWWYSSTAAAAAAFIGLLPLALASAADTAACTTWIIILLIPSITCTTATHCCPCNCCYCCPCCCTTAESLRTPRPVAFHPRTRHFTRLAAISTRASW